MILGYFLNLILIITMANKPQTQDELDWKRRYHEKTKSLILDFNINRSDSAEVMGLQKTYQSNCLNVSENYRYHNFNQKNYETIFF